MHAVRERRLQLAFVSQEDDMEMRSRPALAGAKEAAEKLLGDRETFYYGQQAFGTGATPVAELAGQAW